MKDKWLRKNLIGLIIIWIISVVMYFLDILGPKGNSYIWIAIAIGVTIGTLLNIRRRNKKMINN